MRAMNRQSVLEALVYHLSNRGLPEYSDRQLDEARIIWLGEPVSAAEVIVGDDDCGWMVEVDSEGVLVVSGE